jgi:hypothetical protein
MAPSRTCEKCDTKTLCLVRSAIWTNSIIWIKVGISAESMFMAVGNLCKKYRPQQEKTDAAEIP